MPTIQLEKCIRCMKCVNDCPSRAIDIDAGTIDSTCIHCGHCVAICPELTVFPDQGEITPLTTSTITPEEFGALSSGSRTCRSYRKREVPADVIEKLIENMKHYPSASNKREIQIMVIKSPELVQQLNDDTANMLMKTIKLITAPLIKPFLKLFVPVAEIEILSEYRKKFITQSATNSSQVCHHAPAVMLFHAPASTFSMSGEDAYIWGTYTTIYANTLGLGTCWNGFIVQAMKRSKKMRATFGLPNNHQIHAAILFGYPKVAYKNETSRKVPVAKVI